MKTQAKKKKKKAEDLNRYYSKEYIQMAEADEKSVQHC